jgi:hypothetical protein
MREVCCLQDETKVRLGSVLHASISCASPRCLLLSQVSCASTRRLEEASVPWLESLLQEGAVSLQLLALPFICRQSSTRGLALSAKNSGHRSRRGASLSQLVLGWKGGEEQFDLICTRNALFLVLSSLFPRAMRVQC